MSVQYQIDEASRSVTVKKGGHDVVVRDVVVHKPSIEAAANESRSAEEFIDRIRRLKSANE